MVLATHDWDVNPPLVLAWEFGVELTTEPSKAGGITTLDVIYRKPMYMSIAIGYLYAAMDQTFRYLHSTMYI